MRWLTLAFLAALTFAFFFVDGDGPVRAQTSAKKDPPKAEDATKIAGKSFEQWLKELSGKDPSKRETAIRAICAFPPETAIKGLPAFILELRKHQPSSPIDLSVRCNLCMGIGEMYTLGEKVDPKTTAEAVTLLRYLLSDTQAIVRFRAANALASIGTDAKAAIPEISRMLKEPASWEMRQAAANALGSIAHDPKNGPSITTLKNLYDLLGDPAAQVRQAAVQSLSLLGPPADPALADNYVNSLLPVALKDPEPGLQIWARVAIIGATSDFSQSSISPIVKHVSSVDPGVRRAIQALGTLGPKAKASIGTLMTALTDPETTVQLTAMWALGRMETSAAVALPVLEKMAADPNQSDYVKKAAKDAVEKIKGS